MKIAMFAILAFALFVSFGCLGGNDSGDCSPPCHVSLDDGWTPACSAGQTMCTMEYRLGDACLGYVSCAKENGACAARIDPRFYPCVSCYRACMNASPGQDIFTYCENLCRMA